MRSDEMVRVPEGPLGNAVQDLAVAHAERLYGFAMLMLGDRAEAESVVADAFRRAADSMARDQITGDAADVLYRSATRDTLSRLAKNKQLRGLLPPTTAADDQITAFGILSEFSPQQRAAILLAEWAGLGYRLAGIASGIGDTRTSDLTYAAEREFQEAARESGREPRLGDSIKEIRIPPATTDPVEAAVEAAFRPAPRARGARRLLRLAAGPALLTAVLIGALILIPQCGEPSIKTGAGRTSDIAFGPAAEGRSTLVLDTGSGRELLRLPAGVVSRDGERLYHAIVSCDGPNCSSAIESIETGTKATSQIGQVEGRLAVLDVDEERQRLYLADEGSRWERMLVYDLRFRQVIGATQGPIGIEAPFAPGWVARSPDGSVLATIGLRQGGGQVLVVWTDTMVPAPVNAVRLSIASLEGMALLPEVLDGWVYVYAGARSSEDARLFAAPLSPGDVARGVRTGQADSGSSSAMALGPNGVLYAVGQGGAILRIDLASFQVLGGLPEQSPTDPLTTALAVSSDGQMLYTIRADGSYIVLDATSGRELLRRARVAAASLIQVTAGE